jgi:hypothetical protein
MANIGPSEEPGPQFFFVPRIIREIFYGFLVIQSRQQFDDR